MDPVSVGMLGVSLYNAWNQSSANTTNTEAQKDINTMNIAAANMAAEKQHRWAIEDWNRNTYYNSPAEQMARLKAAGLNPNLAYGSVNNVSAPITHTNVPVPKLDAPHVNPVQLDVAGDLAKYSNVRVNNQNIENMKAQKELLETEAQKNRIETANKGIEGSRSQLELDKARELKDTVIEQEILRTKGLAITNTLAPLDYDLRLASVRLQAAKTDVEVSNIIADTLKKQAETRLVGKQKDEAIARIENLRKEGTLQAFAIKLSENNLTPHDPVYWRLLSDFVDKNIHKSDSLNSNDVRQLRKWGRP